MYTFTYPKTCQKYTFLQAENFHFCKLKIYSFTSQNMYTIKAGSHLAS